MILFRVFGSGMLGVMDDNSQQGAHAQTATPKAPGVRARVRAELTAAIKAQAKAQLEQGGAPSLNLRAIARELDMASSAIYRYFSSRDDLVTALIIDSYDALGDVVEAADAACEPSDHRGRWMAIALALRSWAHAHPHEYALIYGSPIPGYAAPEDTIASAARVPAILLTVFIENRIAAGDVSAGADAPAELDQALEGLMGFTGHTVSAEVLASVVDVWAQLFGLVSLELFGHLKNSVAEDDVYFRHAVAGMADRTLR